jgi:hypothetical protein
MAHAHPPSHGLGAAGSPGHLTAEHEYEVTPPGSGHEHTDANVWIIVKFGLWLAISAVVIHIGLAFLFGLFVSRSQEPTAQFPLAAGQEQRLPAAPRLQRFPVNELYDFRLHEQAVLDKYGWVNKEAGVVRMPIAEAMRVAVERGLPARAPQPITAPDQAVGQTQQGTAPQQTPGLMPADSSSGRTMERRRQ